MNERPTVTVPAEIEEAQLQFENWRCERKRSSESGSLIRNPEVQKSRQSRVLFVGAKRHGLFSFDTSLSRVVSCTPTDQPALREFAPRQRTLRKQGDEERSSFDEISKMVSLGDVPCGRVRPSDLFSPRSNHHQL